MRELLRKVALNVLSLLLVSIAFSGLQVTGGFASYLYAGLLLAILTTIIDPVVKIVTLPFNILTLGLLSFLSTTVALFILTVFYHNVSVVPFKFAGIAFLGITINEINVVGILSLIVISGTIYLSNKLLDWVFTK